MELKLQQAIVAARAGRTDIAQSLLTQLIREKPDEANAWFLLGNIVEDPERQALYLHKTLELEPEHAIAKRRLVQIENEAIPAPVILQQPNVEAQTVFDSGESNGSPPAVEAIFATAAVAERTARAQEPEAAQRDPQTTADRSWTEAAGPPVRERKAVQTQRPAVPVPQEEPSTHAESSAEGTSGEEWLVRILVVMVIVAAIVLGILVLLILL